ncbi:AsnC family transcriptional regulator [Methanocalculus chunghsingensis]|uniref:siroheme decarboxylase n=1 Tax=Methanocalculus chunghsingensis TaxID=156457 RepID=A0A8J7W5B1_9EURY|nr:AsnC family transcriptional regulator [Methanocalculus chunghsingensis]MBR1368536.1 AsnC family transcriptional regulator [Methanocalculus chunghsingensis]
MDQTDRRLIIELERGIPLTDEPFAEIGLRLGITEDEVILRIRRLREEGIIRKIRARINQRQIGIMANALVAWKPPEGWSGHEELASKPGVSHCYLREPVPGRWEYMIYTVHHKRSRNEVYEEVRSIADEIGVTDYIVLFSTEELKRLPAVRIDDSTEDLR